MELSSFVGDRAAMNVTAPDDSLATSTIHVRVNYFGRPRNNAFTRRVISKLEHALARFRDRIDEVRVRVRDVNAQRGGNDQECSLELCMVEGKRLHVSSRAATPFATLHDLTQKAKRLLEPRARRRRS